MWPWVEVRFLSGAGRVIANNTLGSSLRSGLGDSASSCCDSCATINQYRPPSQK